MYDSYIMRRTQIYLDPEQAAALAERASRVGTTSSHLIREAVTEYLAEADRDDRVALSRQRAAVDAAFDILPGLPDADTYLSAVRQGEAARDQMLADRRSAARRRSPRPTD